MVQAQARTMGVRISTRKVRLVADAIRTLPVAKAVILLETTRKRASSVMLKTLKSAVANALQKGNVTEQTLVIVSIEVDEGPTLRRMHIGSRSHVRMYTKRSSNIRIVVSDEGKNEKLKAKNEKQTKQTEETKEKGEK